MFFWSRAGWIAALAALLVFAVSADVLAQYGKISGTVIDKKTKEPIVGATVQIEGTTLGALTDPDGSFRILSVSAGTRTVIVRLVGYNSVRMPDISVSPGQTTPLSVELEMEVLDIKKTITVTGSSKKPIQFDEASTRRTVTSEKIRSMPVTNVADILSKQVGVVIRDGQIHIRGGRSNELIYIVDGVELKDPLGGRGPTESLNLSGQDIENLSILKGGWDAEFGNATSGVINVATKSGDRQVTEGHFELFTDDFGTDALNKYSFNYDRFEFNLGGPDPVFSERLLPALGIEQLKGKLTYSLNGDVDRSDTYASYNNYASPSRMMEYRSTKFLGIKIADRQNNSYNAGFKMTYRMTPDMRWTFIYKGSWERRQPFDDLGGRYGWAYRYTPMSVGWIEDVNDRFSLTFLHNVNKSTYYQVILSRYHRRYSQQPGDPNTPGGRLIPPQFLQYDQWEVYQDNNGNGTYDPPEPFVNIYPDTNTFIGTPKYNFGDVYVDGNFNRKYDAPGTPGFNENSRDSLVYDFNGNGGYDPDAGEAFVDVNGNGKWDSGDPLLNDSNRNGKWDPERRSPIRQDRPEPYIDGDRSLGEPFTDVNNNGVRDSWLQGYSFGEPFVDLSLNSRYDGPNDTWLPGIPYQDLNGNGVYDYLNFNYDFGEPFTDVNGNGKWDPTDGFWDFGFNQWALYHRRDVAISTMNFDLTSQVLKEHEIKAGFKVSDNYLDFGELQYPYYPYDGISSDPGPWPTIGTFRDFYKRKPWTGGFYFRDKMEYGQMVANLGFRWDFFIQDMQSMDSVKAQENIAEKDVVDRRDKFSPRIAFSYPISDKAKVFFNYGHFYQMPEYSYMYQRATQASNAFGIIGNFNIDFKKTIQYEFGIQYAMSPEYVLSIQGFYKDDFGLINSTQENIGPISRNVYENRDYARARGLELELEKKYGNYVSGYANYNYAFAYGKSSSESSNYYDQYYQRDIPIQEFPLNWDLRHQITLNLDLRVPSRDHPKLFGLKLPDNWGINILWQYGSGFPYTPTRDHPGTAEKLVPGEDPLPNSERMPAQSTVDVRFNKDFTVWKLRYTFEIWINNVFDTKNIDNVYGATGRPNTSLNIDGVVYGGLESDNAPSNYGAGRNIRLGLGVNF